MSTSVFLSNDYIRVVAGKTIGKSIRVQTAGRYELPAECLINGVITNENSLKERLKEIWQKESFPVRDVTLIVSSTRFSMKSLKAPAMSRKKLRQYAANEFSAPESGEPMIYDCQIMERDSSGGMVRLLASMAEQDMVESFIKLFRECGIQVSSVCPSRCSVISMLETAGAVKDKTCIIQLAEGADLRSILCVEGTYTYSSRTRLFCSRDTEEMGAELAKSVSGILQFAMSQKLSHKITDVYLAGLTQREQEYCRDSIGLLEMNLHVSQLEGSFVSMPEGISFSDYVSPISGLMAGKETINLADAFPSLKKGIKEKGKLWKYLLPPAASLLVMAVILAALLIRNSFYETKLAGLLELQNSQAAVMGMEESQNLSSRVNTLSALLAQISDLNDAAKSYPKADTSVLEAVEDAAEGFVSVQIKGYQADTGSLSIVAYAARVDDISPYIDALEETGLFRELSYSGYQLQNMGNQSAYKIQLTGYLSQAAGK